MWYKIADFVMKNKVILLILLLGLTVFMGFQATKVKMSYNFNSAIPTDNPKYIDYQKFVNTFGQDGSRLMVGIQTDQLFKEEVFNDFIDLTNNLRAAEGVENVLGITTAVNITTDSNKQLMPVNIFPKTHLTQAGIDSLKNVFSSLPIYKGLLYNPESNAYLLALGIKEATLNTPNRVNIINNIENIGNQFGAKHNIEMHYSGLPYIRTKMATSIQHEITLFLVLSFVLTAIILFAFFRSLIAVITSMIVVGIGVVCSFGTIALMGYEITILTGMIPPLIVVIGIPNCVYFLNKYHAAYTDKPEKHWALREMVGKMGVVTLFTNLTAAIGFGVFFFTKSIILKEFGLVAGLNIMGLFFISLIFIPAIYSYLKPPNTKHTNYLENKWLNGIINVITNWVFNNRKAIYLTTILVCILGVVGMTKLKALAYIVDDLPKSDKTYTDLKFFEKNFKGVMPLEFMIDTKKKYGAITNYDTWQKIEDFSNYLESDTAIGGGLSLIKGVKFVKQAYARGAEDSYVLPSAFEFGSLRPQLLSAFRKKDEGKNSQQINDLLYTYLDSTGQIIRLGVNVADIGSLQMPVLLSKIQPVVDSIFNKDAYDVTITGTSITFLEGSKFIINSLGESLLLAFSMILVCMIILFRSWRIVLIALCANIVPLILTGGLMGWLNIPLKPSTVLVFSVALGITVDVTIRFLVNFKQELKNEELDISETVRKTMHDTGLSIIFTSIILIIGFGVFAISGFQSIKYLGYLTALTLLMATITNLTLQPAMLLWLNKVRVKKNKNII